MKANNYFKSQRADAGGANRLIEEIKNAPPSPGGSVLSWDGLADWLLQKYDSRVRAKLRGMGLNVPESGPLTVDGIKATIREKTGLEVEDMSVDGITAAFDKQMASELSERLGFQVSTVFDQAAMKAQVREVVLAKLADGTAAGLLKGKTLRAARSLATFQRAGISPDAAQKILNQKYQKKYRRTHKQIWA